jgi:hypothetical protein
MTIPLNALGIVDASSLRLLRPRPVMMPFRNGLAGKRKLVGCDGNRTAAQ